jgi:hypothetical protein
MRFGDREVGGESIDIVAVGRPHLTRHTLGNAEVLARRQLFGVQGIEFAERRSSWLAGYSCV